MCAFLTGSIVSKHSVCSCHDLSIALHEDRPISDFQNSPFPSRSSLKYPPPPSPNPMFLGLVQRVFFRSTNISKKSNSTLKKGGDCNILEQFLKSSHELLLKKLKQRIYKVISWKINRDDDFRPL